MKKLILLSLTLLPFIIFAQEATVSDNSTPQPEVEYAQWFNQLNQHLIKSENNLEVAMGVAAMINGALQISDKDSTSETKDLLPQLTNILNELIAQADLNQETLDLLMAWCFKPGIVENCDKETLLEKHQKKQPDNMNVYFKVLQQAVEENNQGAGIQAMDSMSQAKYNHMTLNTTAGFNETIDQYVENNPLPESYLSALTTDKNFTSEDGKNAKDIEQKVKGFAITAIKSAYSMFYEAPDLRPLFFLCKTNTEFSQECLNITNTLINHSNTINATGQGHAILMGIYENQDNKTLFNEAKKKQEQFRNYLKCLSQATTSPNSMKEFFEPGFQQIQLKSTGDLTKLKELAKYIYNKYKDSNPSQPNPDLCAPNA